MSEYNRAKLSPASIAPRLPAPKTQAKDLGWSERLGNCGDSAPSGRGEGRGRPTERNYPFINEIGLCEELS